MAVRVWIELIEIDARVDGHKSYSEIDVVGRVDVSGELLLYLHNL